MPVWWSSSVSIHGLLRALTFISFRHFSQRSYNPRALTSPDGTSSTWIKTWYRFQSAGSYEPWHSFSFFLPCSHRFNPRALTSPDTPANAWAEDPEVSIRGLLRALTIHHRRIIRRTQFQSTGSYEPWQQKHVFSLFLSRFNPRALTSPDAVFFMHFALAHIVSIHGLLRALTWGRDSNSGWTCFNPRALTSPDWAGQLDSGLVDVSIHGLLRALTAISNKLFAKNCRIFYIIHNSNHNRK